MSFLKKKRWRKNAYNDVQLRVEGEDQPSHELFPKLRIINFNPGPKEKDNIK